MTTKEAVAQEMEQYEKAYCGVYSTQPDAKERLMHLCDLADSLGDEFDLEDLYFTVDPKIRHGYLHLEVIDIVFSNGRSHYFFDGVKDADFIGFEKAPSGNLRLNLGVENLWVMK